MEKNFHLETEELLRTIEEFKEVHQISHENLGSFISTVVDFSLVVFFYQFCFL